MNNKQVKRALVETARLAPVGDDFVEEPRVITEINNYEADSSQWEKLSFDLNGNLLFRQINTCNPEGRLIGIVTYNADGSVRHQSIITTETQTSKETVRQTSKEAVFNGDGSLRHHRDTDLINSRAVETRVYGPLSWIPGRYILIKDTGSRQDWDILRPDGSLAAKAVAEYRAEDWRYILSEYQKNGTLAKKTITTLSLDRRYHEKTEYDGKGVLLMSEVVTVTLSAEGEVIKSFKRRCNLESGKMEPVSVRYPTVEYF